MNIIPRRSEGQENFRIFPGNPEEHSSTPSPEPNGRPEPADVREAAVDALSHGLSIFPPAQDGSKRPDGPWKHFQAKRATPADVDRWYGTDGPPKRSGLGLVCGAVSGNLECFEFDASGQAYREFKEAAKALGLADLVERIESGFLERSPSGGIHWLYFCDVVGGNTELARYVSDEIDEKTGHPKIKVLIETRGEGGYIVVSPSHGTVHPTGQPYELLRGGFDKIARITKEEHEALFGLARTFNEIHEPETAPHASNGSRPATNGKAKESTPDGWPATVSPWEDFDSRTDWSEILPHGWVHVYTRGDVEYWRRPGKDINHSATIRRDTGRIYVFSSATEFPQENALSKTDAHAWLHHGGNLKAAYKDLRDRGFGSYATWVREGDEWKLRVFQNPVQKGHRIAEPGDKPPTGPPRAKVEPSANGHEPKAKDPRQAEPKLPPPDVDAIIATANKFEETIDILVDGDFLSECARLDAVGMVRVETVIRERKLGIRTFRRAVKEAQAKISGETLKNDGGVSRYDEEDGCITSFSAGILSNFTARIVTQIERHEAGEIRRLFEIQATHTDGRQVTVKTFATKYTSMDWVTDQLGAEFVILAGKGFKDEVRAAIQLFSDHDGIARSEVHTSLGWIENEGKMLYLHVGGSISSDVTSRAVNVEASPALARYVLPDPPKTEDTTAEAIESCFRIANLTKTKCNVAKQCTAVLMSLPWRAVMGPFNSSIHFSGLTGTQKTSAAKLALGFFAKGGGARDADVSCSWEATLNALQRYAFDCRDSLLLVDELTGDRAVTKATEFFQAQGNLKGRARMNKDLSLAPTLDPRGSVLSTGEVDPLRQSALGRMLTVRFVTPIKGPELDQCQKDSGDGLHSLAMSAFIRWLAKPGRLEEKRAQLRKRSREIEREIWNDPLTKDVHSRQPEAVAELRSAYEIFLDFAVESGGITREGANVHLRIVEEGLGELLMAQAENHKESNPAQRFLSMLAAGLGSKRYYLENVEGDKAPEPYASALGWSREDTGRGFDWKTPGGSIRLGYVDVAARVAYVEPELAKTLAQTIGRDSGQTFESTGNIARDLHVLGALKIRGDETGRTTRYTPTKKIRGASKRYIWIKLDHIVGEDGDAENDATDESAFFG